MKAQIGIDVSKQKLDVSWLRDPASLKVKSRVFKNRRNGFEVLIDWMKAQTGLQANGIQVMMEATGIYHEALAYNLYEAGFEVFVVNPYHVSEYRKSLGRRSKTDKKDSVVLARFLHNERDHQLWCPEPPEVRHLKALLARLDALDTDIQREYNRREKADIQKASDQVVLSIQKMINALEEERKRLEARVDDHFDQYPQLKTDRKLLESIPGIGRVLSAELTALIRSRAFKSAGQTAAFVGLVPIISESGSSVRRRAVLAKTGSARLRAKLYMGAIVAIRHNAHIKAHYDNLVARGKAKMSALGAAMRKLVQMAFGVLRHQQSYDPQWVN